MGAEECRMVADGGAGNFKALNRMEKALTAGGSLTQIFTVQAIKDVDGVLFICADHGNAEQLIDEETGEPFTAHTTNPVPFILVNADPAYKLHMASALCALACERRLEARYGRTILD